MIMAILGAWWTSKPLQYATAVLALLCFYEGWKIHQRNIGAANATVAITQKADDNAKKAEQIRDSAPSARGPDDPNRLR
jgi:hypothetical protein